MSRIFRVLRARALIPGTRVRSAADAIPSDTGPMGERRRVVVIGIETSCDDTCVSILSVPVISGKLQRAGTVVLADVAASQHRLNATAGGVVPHFAARAHASQLPRVYAAAVSLAERSLRLGSGLTLPTPAVIAVTCGPGLAGCLREGLEFAKGISASPPSVQGSARAPPPAVMSVHHLEAHLLVPRMGSPAPGQPPLEFPYLVLLVSGGHSSLILARGVGLYDTLASTLDDALGEAFDKVARGLEVWRHPPRVTAHAQLQARSEPPSEQDGRTLRVDGSGSEASAGWGTPTARGPHPSSTPLSHLGAQLEALALEGDERTYPFSVPLLNTRGAIPCAFSFAGLKSAVHRLIDASGSPRAHRLQNAAREVPAIDVTSRASVADAAAAFQRCVASHLIDQLDRASNYCALQAQLGLGPRVETLVVCGGVAANAFLRGALEEAAPAMGLTRVAYPPAALCVDNGVMVAWTAVERLAAAAEGALCQDTLALDAGSAQLLSSEERLSTRAWGVLPLAVRHPWLARGQDEVASLDFDASWQLGADPPIRSTRVAATE